MTIARQIGPYILSIAKVKERLDPRSASIPIIIAEIESHHVESITDIRRIPILGSRSQKNLKMTALRPC